MAALSVIQQLGSEEEPKEYAQIRGRPDSQEWFQAAIDK
jgi:hypothetical protein